METTTTPTPLVLDAQGLKDYNQFLNVKGYSKNTKEAYTRYAKRWIGKTLTQEHINADLTNPPNNYRSFLRGLTEGFQRYDLRIPRTTGRKKKNIIHYLTKAEVEKLFTTAPEARLRLMYKFCFQLGLRASEVCNIQKRNIDTVNKKIRGVGKGNKAYEFPIPDTTLQDLIPYMERFEPEDYIFQWPDLIHQRHKFYFELKRHAKEALPHRDIRHIHPHVFRHSLGTYLKELGFDLRDIQTVLRHADIRTVEVYTAVNMGKLKEKWHEAMR